MPTDSAKIVTTEQDPEALLRLMDLELKQKRVQWQQAAARHRTTRITTFVSLFVVVAVAIVALYFVFSQASTQRPRPADPASQAP